jgi:flagellar motor switch protein FliM
MLQLAYETFARHWSTLLTSTLRVVSQATLLSIEQITYDEYVSGLANPTCMSLLDIEPLSGVGVFELSNTTVMTAIDHLLGGPGGPNQPQRPLTDLERPLFTAMTERVLGELRYAMEPIVKFQPKLGTMEYNPQFAQAASASDMVIVASFELHQGDEESIASLCFPYASLAPYLDKASGRSVTSDRERAIRDAASIAVRAGLSEVPIEVAVRFDGVRVTPKDLVDLAVGDVLPLGHPTSRPLTVTAADIVFAYAVPGAQGKRLACLVVEPPKEESSR